MLVAPTIDNERAINNPSYTNKNSPNYSPQIMSDAQLQVLLDQRQSNTHKSHQTRKYISAEGGMVLVPKVRWTEKYHDGYCQTFEEYDESQAVFVPRKESGLYIPKKYEGLTLAIKTEKKRDEVCNVFLKSFVKVKGLSKGDNARTLTHAFRYHGFDASITLEREPDNIYDENAIAVLIRGKKFGYIEREVAQMISEEYPPSMPLACFAQRIYMRHGNAKGMRVVITRPHKKSKAYNGLE